MKLTLKEQVNVLFQSWLYENCNDSLHTNEDFSNAEQDEDFQIEFLKFVEKNL